MIVFLFVLITAYIVLYSLYIIIYSIYSISRRERTRKIDRTEGSTKYIPNQEMYNKYSNKFEFSEI